MDFIMFPAIFCLLLGVTSGEYMGNFDSQGNLINDGLNQESRRLLYVVGVYPEWAKKITEFKEKWGEVGEKYLKQPNVYIHGDIPVSGEKKARRLDEAMIRPLQPFFQAPFIPDTRRNNSKQKDTKQEWTKKMAEFKEKLDEDGEKYTNPPNGYIHRDFLESNEKNSRRIDEAMIRPLPAFIPDTRRDNSKQKDTKQEWAKRVAEFKEKLGEDDEKYMQSSDEKRTRKIDEAMIRPLQPLFQAPFIPDTRRNNTKQKDATKQDVLNFRRQHIIPGIVTINVTHDRRENNEKGEVNEVARRRAMEYQKFAMHILNPDEMDNEPMRKKNIKIRKGVLRKLNNLENEDQPEVKDDSIQRKFTNIDRMYHHLWLKKSEPPNKEAIKNNEDIARRFSNINRIYSRVTGRKLGIEDDPEDTETTASKYNYWLRNVDEEGLMAKNNYKKYRTVIETPQGKIYASPVDSFNTKDYVPQGSLKVEPEQELMWIKQILLPKLINARQAEELKANQNVGGGIENSVELRSYPTSSANTLNRKNINFKQFEDNTDEKKAKRDLNLKTVESGEDFLKQRLEKRRREAGKLNIKLDEDAVNEDTNI